MKEKLNTILFTVLVTAVFAILVSGVNAALETRINANKLIARQKVILSLFGLLTSEITEPQIPELFSAKIVLAPAFKDSKIEGYQLKSSESSLLVCSFVGQGFWDAIKGYIALDLSKKTIKGIEFTQQGETPGLGGRIVEPEFKARFVDKPFDKIRGDGLRLKFVSEGSANRADEIDGITGATGTTTALEKIINSSIGKIVELHERGTSK